VVILKIFRGKKKNPLWHEREEEINQCIALTIYIIRKNADYVLIK